MKKFTALLLVMLMLCSCCVTANAEDTINSGELLKQHSPSEITVLYPELCDYLAGQFREYKTDISVESFGVNVKDIDSIFFSVLCENPDIFYINPHDFETTVRVETNDLISIRPYYLLTGSALTDAVAEFDKATEKYLEGISPDWSDCDKALYLHDKLVLTCEYDMEEFNQDLLIFTAYGAMVMNDAVCEGYTLAYKHLLSKVGVESHYIQSLPMRHSWNLVYIDGKIYHVDVTYDDPSNDNLGRVEHKWFLLSDNEISSGGVHHDWASSAKAGSKIYDKSWVKNVSTAIYKIGDSDYYIDQLYSASIYGSLMRRNRDTGANKSQYMTTARWLVADMANGAFWERAYCYLAYDGKYFYFNDTDSIYRLEPGSTKPEAIYTKPENTDYDIYGLAFRLDGTLRVTIKKNPSDMDVIYALSGDFPEPTGNNPKAPLSVDSYEVKADGTVKLLRYETSDENLILPDTINGKTVTELGSNLLAGNTSLKNVIIPDTITEVPSLLFYNCTKLESVTLPKNLKRIESAAFMGCESLGELLVPDTVAAIGKNAFMGCVNITLKGKKGSVAESYAKSYGISFEELNSEPEPDVPVPTVKTVKLSVKLYVKQTCKVTNDFGGSVKYTSKNKSIASVSSKGVITGKKAGKTVVTANSSGITAKITVTVVAPKLTKKTFTLKKGNTYTIKIVGKVGKATFKSANKKIATVNSKGKVRARKRGKTTITVKSNGVTMKCVVKVK